MFLGSSVCSLCYCATVILSLCIGVMSQDITFTPPNSEGWVSPDGFFTSTDDIKVQRKGLLRSSGKEGAVKKTIEKPGRPEGTDPMKCPAETDGAKLYLKRFVRLLLDVSNLNDDEIESENHAELKFSISGDHLLMLQQFTRDGDVGEISLRKVDEILAAMLVKPYSYLPKLPKLPSFEGFLNFLQHFKIGSSFISIFLPAAWFIIVLSFTGKVFKSFVWLTPVAFVSSFITTGQRLYEEQEAKQHELMHRYSDIPEHCFQSGKDWSFFSWSHKDECSKYFRLHNIDPKLGITTVKVFFKMFGEVLSDVMEHVGVGTSNYFGAFAEMSLVHKLIVLPLASVLLYLFSALVLLWLSGGSFRLPFFLGSWNFHRPHLHNDAVPSNRHTVSSASLNTETAPSTSNITINFHQALPANVHELLRSFSQNQIPNINAALPATSNETGTQQQIHGSYITPDVLGGGDSSSAMQIEPSHWSGSTSRKAPKPSGNVGLKKLPKQLSQLQSKYKSGYKSSSKSASRIRHLSL